MRPVNVMVVDDSIVVRRLIPQHFKGHPRIRVEMTAKDGLEALRKLRGAGVDLVLLDVEMPKMNGVEALQKIQSQHPDIQVVMFSAINRAQAGLTLEALSYGAADYITKPSALGGAGLDEVWRALEGRIDALCPDEAPSASPPPASPQAPKPARPAPEPAPRPPRERTRRGAEVKRVGLKPTPPPRVARAATPTPRVGPSATPAPRLTGRLSPADVLIIGSSTGGPKALNELLMTFPGALRVPTLIVQHMPPVFTQCLAERLARKTGLVVREAVDGEAVKAGEILIAPGGFHMRVARRASGVIVKLDEGPEVNFVRPAVDVLLESVEATYGGRSRVAILTGMGRDGCAGCAGLSSKGATIFAQDQATSVVWGMPGAVTKAGLADEVLPLPQIGPRITQGLL